MVVKKNRNEPGRILVDPDPVGARHCRCWSELLLSWVVAGCSCVSHRLLLIFAPGGCPELLAAAGVVCLARHCCPVLLAAAGVVAVVAAWVLLEFAGKRREQRWPAARGSVIAAVHRKKERRRPAPAGPRVAAPSPERKRGRREKKGGG
ncbi:hypothetical protein KY289_007829 [Solanum tuberosum]|nr:hypothetical protein KY289_007829 [Solanum tuberosum]